MSEQFSVECSAPTYSEAKIKALKLAREKIGDGTEVYADFSSMPHTTVWRLTDSAAEFNENGMGLRVKGTFLFEFLPGRRA